MISSPETVIEITYIIAAVLFILALKWLSSPTTARRGVWAGEIGMVLAIAGTLLHHGIVDYKWIAIALVLGAIIGVPLGNVAMTAVPQRTALSHAFGALCVTLVGTAEFYLRTPEVPRFTMSLAFGVMLIIPIGGADMPTVISLLNSYAGLSAAAMGFVLDSKLLIVAGALDGASGFILSVNMSKAMNRSFTNVLFGAFGQVQAPAAAAHETRPVRSATAEEAAAILAAANKVVVVPGYGMAVAQAQHKVRELYDALTKRGVDVTF